jgi:hypothetical protein
MGLNSSKSQSKKNESLVPIGFASTNTGTGSNGKKAKEYVPRLKKDVKFDEKTKQNAISEANNKVDKVASKQYDATQNSKDTSASNQTQTIPVFANKEDQERLDSRLARKIVWKEKRALRIAEINRAEEMMTSGIAVAVAHPISENPVDISRLQTVLQIYFR